MQQASARFEELCRTFAAEKFLHFVIYVLKSKSLLAPISTRFAKLRGFVCFIPLEDLLRDGVDPFACYGYDDELTPVKMRDYVADMAQEAKPRYTPASTLDLEVPD